MNQWVFLPRSDPENDSKKAVVILGLLLKLYSKTCGDEGQYLMTTQNDQLDVPRGYSKEASSDVLIGNVEESSHLFSVERENDEEIKVIEMKCLGEFNCRQKDKYLREVVPSLVYYLAFMVQEGEAVNIAFLVSSYPEPCSRKADSSRET